MRFVTKAGGESQLSGRQFELCRWQRVDLYSNMTMNGLRNPARDTLDTGENTVFWGIQPGTLG